MKCFLDLGVQIVQKEIINATGVHIWENAAMMEILIALANL